MKSFRRIIFSSFLVILLSISFGASLALTDAATATFIGSVDSRYIPVIPGLFDELVLIVIFICISELERTLGII